MNALQARSSPTSLAPGSLCRDRFSRIFLASLPLPSCSSFFFSRPLSASAEAISCRPSTVPAATVAVLPSARAALCEFAGEVFSVAAVVVIVVVVVFVVLYYAAPLSAWPI